MLSFGAFTLAQPTRGGRRHNLTTKIKARASDFFTTATKEMDTLFTPRADLDRGGRGATGRRQSLAAAVAAKLEDGNIRAAARILCSDDKPVPINQTTLEELRLKRPALGADRPPMPNLPATAPIQMSESEALASIRSFPAGSSAGPDGIRPNTSLS